MTALALALATLIGLSLGLLGSGGSIITLPVLVYVAGVDAHQAVGMSLVVVGGTSALGSFLKHRGGVFHLKAAAYFASSGAVGAYLGARGTHLLPAPALLLVFGLLMLGVGARLLTAGEPRPGGSRSCHPARCLAAGLAVGMLTGFLGVGGGFLILPALVLFAGLDMKSAIGTSLGVITVNCAGGLVGQLRYVSFDGWLASAFLAASAVGMFAGVLLAGRLSATVLRRVFAAGVLLLGLALVARNALLLARLR